MFCGFNPVYNEKLFLTKKIILKLRGALWINVCVFSSRMMSKVLVKLCESHLGWFLRTPNHANHLDYFIEAFLSELCLCSCSRGSLPWGWTVANSLVFKKVRNALGLDRCKICISAAAPIMRDTLEFFMGLNITVTEIYGMSESTGKGYKSKYHKILSGCADLFHLTLLFFND